MSDINDLIHTNARVAFDQGVKTERNAVIQKLQEELSRVKGLPFAENDARVILAQMSAIEKVIARIESDNDA
jgi:hypothetical protein